MIKKVLTSTALTLAAGSALALTIVSTPTIGTDTTWGGAANPSPIILQQPVFVKSGATLTILPGTIVRGQPRTAAVLAGSTVGVPGSLIITQTGKINAAGNATDPIIMTTAAVDNNNDGIPDDGNNDTFLDAYPGYDPTTWVIGGDGTLVADATPSFYDDDPKNFPLAPLDKAGVANVSLWGGMVVCGNAPTNLSDPSGLGFGKDSVEGLTVPGFPVVDSTYGGALPHDNSGVMEYISVRHAGDEIGDSNELNGITLAGVGNGTVFQNIEVYCNFDDGIEWFGGTVNGKNLAVFFVGDDSFDLDQGYTGLNQFCFAVSTFFNENSGATYGSASGDKAGEWDGEDGDGKIAYRRNGSSVDDATNIPWPLSYPIFHNLTVIGNQPNVDGSVEFAVASAAGANKGINMRNGFAGELWNSIIVNTGTEAGLNISDDKTVTENPFTSAANAANGLMIVGNTTFSGVSGTIQANVIANGDAITAGVGGDNKTTSAMQLVKEDQTFNPTGDAAGKLVSSLKSSPLNPRPPQGFLAPTTDRITVADFTIAGFEKVTERGAFGSSPATQLWTTGWTALNRAGLLAD